MPIKKVYSKRQKRHVWAFDLRVNGKRYRDAGFATKEEVESAVAALKLAAREAKYGIRPIRLKHTTMAKVIDAYAKRLIDQMILRRGADYAKRNSGYLARLRRWGQFVGLEKHVSTIDAEDLSDWAQAEIDRGLKEIVRAPRP